jgi:beta-lactamase regulating signal transducer with metallopeptidase domain
MTTLTTALTENASVMFAVAAEVALKGTLLMAAVAAGAFALRRASASLRHSLWSFALLSMLFIPVLSLAIPRWQIGMLPTSSDPLPAARNPLPLPLPVRSTPIADIREPMSAAGSALPAASAGNTVEPTGPSIALLDSLALLWLGGVIVGLITITGGLLTLHRVALDAAPAAGPEWHALLAELKAQLRIERNVRLLVTNSTSMPATWGVIRPIVLLPADAEHWDDERRRVVLLHELAHVQRNDYLMQTIAQLCCTVYWFHPGVWYSARQLRAERELACDEHVIGAGINACDYAEHLLEIALTFRSPARASIAGVAMARPSQLEGRLQAILSEDIAARWRASHAVKAGSLVALTALVFPLAAMRPWSGAAPGSMSTTASPVATTEIVAALSESPSNAPADTLRWKGTVSAGKWVEVLSRLGDIRAELSRNGQVEILAFPRGNGARNVRLGADRTNGAARICAIDSSVPDSPPLCRTGAAGELRNGVPDVRVDFLIRVPAGVGISAHTGRGNVTAESVRSYVWGTSGQGNISITTTDLAEASTRVGSISAQFGRRTWRQNLEFLTDNGNVTVLAPSDARMTIEAHTDLGTVRSEFPGEVKRFGSGQRLFTHAGARGGALTLRSGRGTVELRRGSPAVAESSDIHVEYGDAPRSYVDPKPNWNEDPADNPDPNPNPNVEDMDAHLESDDPTGERVLVTIPDGLLDRFTDPKIRTWPDAQAIARLRNIAATHKKQHPADLVRERAEWALSIVRNGEIVAPLREALSSSDWRIRAYAAWAVGQTRDPRAGDILTAALSDPHWRVRMHAAGGLQHTAGPGSVDPLITALRDDYWQVRISAVDALAAIGDRRAISALRQVAERDPREMIRADARRAIERIN